jgi:hypothetical protein
MLRIFRIGGALAKVAPEGEVAVMIRSRLRWEIAAALTAKAMLLLVLYLLFFAHDQSAARTAPAVLQHLLDGR